MEPSLAPLRGPPVWGQLVICNMFLIMSSVLAGYMFRYQYWLVICKPLCLDPSDGVFGRWCIGRFDLASLCGTLRICCDYVGEPQPACLSCGPGLLNVADFRVTLVSCRGKWPLLLPTVALYYVSKLGC